MRVKRVIVDEMPINCANCTLVDVPNRLCGLTLNFILRDKVRLATCPLVTEDALNQRIAELQDSIVEYVEWNAILCKAADELRATNNEYARYISDEQLEQKAVEIAERKDAALWVKAYSALQEQPKLQSRIAYLEEQLRWRDVSEKPTVADAYEVKYIFGVTNRIRYSIDLFSVTSDEWISQQGTVVEWRPIPEADNE